MIKIVHHILFKLLPGYVCSLVIGAVIFCVGFSLDPAFSVRGYETNTILQTVQNLFVIVFTLAALIVSPLALVAIACSEVYRWKSMWLYLIVSSPLSLFSFAIFIFLSENLPWVLLLGDGFTGLHALGSVRLFDWGLVLISSSGGGFVYWLLRGRWAGWPKR